MGNVGLACNLEEENDPNYTDRNSTCAFFGMPSRNECAKTVQSEAITVNEPVVIFDWDDTLMCSSDLKHERVLLDGDRRMLQTAVLRVLRTAMNLGRVAIVTNADLSWVYATARCVVPSVLPLLEYIQVVSAREMYGERWPGESSKWKQQAMRDVVVGESVESCTSPQGCAGMSWLSAVRGVVLPGYGSLNLVVLGDSKVDIEAGEQALTGVIDQPVIKTVKFMKDPSVRDLVGELEAVAGELHTIVGESYSSGRMLDKIAGEWTVKPKPTFFKRC